MQPQPPRISKRPLVALSWLTEGARGTAATKREINFNKRLHKSY